MLKAQTGTSIKSDVKLAGQEAAQAVKEVKMQRWPLSTVVYSMTRKLCWML